MIFVNLMNKTLGIATIALVAVVMGMSSVAPAMAAEATPACICPVDFVSSPAELKPSADKNGNGIICLKELHTGNFVAMDDIVVPEPTRGGSPRR